MEQLKQEKPYLFWRGEINDVETLLEQSISLQDKKIIDTILSSYWYEVIKDVMIDKLYDMHNTLFAKKKYDKVFNYIIYQTYHKDTPKSWML